MKTIEIIKAHNINDIPQYLSTGVPLGMQTLGFTNSDTPTVGTNFNYRGLHKVVYVIESGPTSAKIIVTTI